MNKDWLALGIVLLTVGIVMTLSRRRDAWLRHLFNWMPPILLAYIIPALFTHLFRLQLSEVSLHQWSRYVFIPLAILSVMGALSFRQLRIIGIRPVLLFVSGSFLIATLAPLFVLSMGSLYPSGYELFITEEYWKGLVPIVGGWIGGSTSQLVLKELVACPEDLFLAVLVLDNILVNLWTILMFQMIKRSDRLNEWWKIQDKIPDFVPDQPDLSRQGRRAIGLTAGLIIIGGIVVVSLVGSFLWQIILLSVLGLLFGNFIPFWNHAFVLKAGGVLIVCIMAILGLKLNFFGFALPAIVVFTCILWLIAHYAGMLTVAKFLKLNMAWVPISSMANLGGISTAPAVTAAYNEEWMPHAILLAILSMVTGTAWGMVTIFLFQLF